MLNETCNYHHIHVYIWVKSIGINFHRLEIEIGHDIEEMLKTITIEFQILSYVKWTCFTVLNPLV